jgi:hypothetical protein
MMDLMSSRAVRDREQEQHEAESSEGAQTIPQAAAQPQYTSRGAVPPVQTETAPAAGPSASERAFGPAGLGATAYTSGASQFAPAAAPVPHEAAHVVQQRQGRVAKPVVEDEGPEHEADETSAGR